MMIQRAFVLAALAIVLSIPVAAGAQTAPARSPLDAATNGYFDAVANANWGAFLAGTTYTFHVILPDGKRLSNEEFLRERMAHFLISTPAIVTLKIGPSTISDGTATETVKSSSFDSAMIGGLRSGAVIEKDYETHQLSWVRGRDGAWLLDEDHITAALHTPY
jgi:hypothetical protein